MAGNVSMIGQRGGQGEAAIFGRNNVGGTPPPQAMGAMPQQQTDYGTQTMQMMKLIQDLKKQKEEAALKGGGSTGGMMGGKNASNPGAAQSAASSIGTMGGGM